VAEQKLHPEQFEAFRRAAMTLSDERVGKLFGIGETVSGRWRKRLGVVRDRIPCPSALTEEEKQEIRRAWGKESLHAIARRLGRCYATVQHFAKKVGLPLPGNGWSWHGCHLPREVYTAVRVAVFNRQVTLREIAKTHGVSYKVVRHISLAVTGHRKPGGESRTREHRWRISEGLHRYNATRRARGLPARAALPGFRWRCWNCGKVNENAAVCGSHGCGTEFGTVNGDRNLRSQTPSFQG
jgi:hypothetical protein